VSWDDVTKHTKPSRHVPYAPRNLKLLIHIPHTHSTCKRTLHPPPLHVHSLYLPLFPCVPASRLRPHAHLCSGGTHSTPMEQREVDGKRGNRTARGGRGCFLCNLNRHDHIGNCRWRGGYWMLVKHNRDQGLRWSLFLVCGPRWELAID